MDLESAHGPGGPTLLLNDGTAIPRFGLGVWRVPERDTAALVTTALQAGYRHIDTAQGYGNETGVGRGIRDSGVPRSQVWITTKLSGAHGYDAAMRDLDASLERLGVDHVDLYLIHSPGRDVDVEVETWRALRRLRGEGRTRSVGVSNFPPRLLDRLIDATGVTPSVNQIKLHPREPRKAHVRHHRRRGIATQSWAPLDEGRLLDHRVIVDVARRRGCTSAQALVAWHLRHGHVVFPKSASPQRLHENLGALDVALTDDDMARIDGLGRFDEPRRYWRGVTRRVRRVLGT